MDRLDLVLGHSAPAVAASLLALTQDIGRALESDQHHLMTVRGVEERLDVISRRQGVIDDEVMAHLQELSDAPIERANEVFEAQIADVRARCNPFEECAVHTDDVPASGASSRDRDLSLVDGHVPTLDDVRAAAGALLAQALRS